MCLEIRVYDLKIWFEGFKILCFASYKNYIFKNVIKSRSLKQSSFPMAIGGDVAAIGGDWRRLAAIGGNWRRLAAIGGDWRRLAAIGGGYVSVFRTIGDRSCGIRSIPRFTPIQSGISKARIGTFQNVSWCCSRRIADHETLAFSVYRIFQSWHHPCT